MAKKPWLPIAAARRGRWSIHLLKTETGFSGGLFKFLTAFTVLPTDLLARTPNSCDVRVDRRLKLTSIKVVGLADSRTNKTLIPSGI